MPVVGVDVASVARMLEVLKRRPGFSARVYTAAEQRDCAAHPRRWASRWAVKEAVRKCFGAAGISPLPAFSEIEVWRDPGGAPRAEVRGSGARIAVSLSHEGDLAFAVAVMEASGHALLEVDPSIRLAERPDDANKGTFGTVVVVAGSHGFSGAAYLAAMGAARAGAGRVRLCVPRSLFGVMAVKCTEVMAHPLADGGRGTLGEEAVVPLLEEHLPAAQCLAIGPGIGTAAETRSALAELLPRVACPAVVDADGLNIAAASGFDWRSVRGPVVLTPHPAELARLAGVETAEVQRDRLAMAQGYARRHGVVVVLKGSDTVVAAPDGRLHTAGARLVALATGGTGDVLCGVIAALVAGGLEPFTAAVAGVAVHAEAGAAVQRRHGRAGGLAGDLLDALPAAQERIRLALERGVER